MLRELLNLGLYKMKIFWFVLCMPLWLIGNYYQWGSNGPEGGAIYSIINPNIDTLWAGTESGIFKTEDEGNNWIRKGLGKQRVYAIYDASDALYAGVKDNGVFRSTDGGNSWSLSGLEGKTILSLIENSGIYAGTETTGVYLSTDSGQTWSADGLDTLSVYDLTGDTNKLFAGTDDGVYEKKLGSWSQSGLSGNIVYALGIKGDTVYAGTEDSGVYISTNGGFTWSSTSLDSITVFSLVVDSSNNTHAHAGTVYGVYSTTDGGNTWNPIGPDSMWILSIASDTAFLPYVGTFGPGFFKYTETQWQNKNTGLNATYTKSVDVLLPDVYGGIVGGIFESNDTGTTWDTTGFYNHGVNGVAIGGSADTLYAGCDSGGYRSVDKGIDWAVMPDIQGKEVYCISVRPDSTPKLLAGCQDGIYLSQDAGNTWKIVSSTPALSIAFSPNPDTIYAGDSTGLWISTDGGDSFTSTNISQPTFSIAVHPGSAGVVYVGTNNGIFISRDGGNTYDSTLVGKNVHSLSINREKPLIIYAGAQEGFYRSWDGGNNWEQLNSGLSDTTGIWSLKYQNNQIFSGTRVGIFEFTEDTIPPGIPNLLSPTNYAWINDSTPLLDWTDVGDDASGLLFYVLDVDTNTNFIAPIISETTSISSFNTSPLSEDRYYWRVRAIDRAYNESGASDTFSFGIDITHPIGATASSPEYSTVLSFTVKWSGATDSGGSGLSGEYNIKIKDGTGSWQDWLTNYSGDSAVYSGVDGHKYYFEALAIDSAGNIEDFSGTPECSTLVDTTHPYITATNPADGDTGVALNSNIDITFSEQMDTLSMDTSDFSVQGNINGSYTFTFSYNPSNYTVTINPDSDFAYQETIQVKVDTTITDVPGNRLKNTYTFNFSCTKEADTLGPTTSSANASPSSPEPVGYLTITAYASDVNTGNSNIAGAEYFIDATGTSGTGIAMSAADTFFDEPSEDVIDTLDTAPLGWKAGDNHSIYIHSKDAAGNWGEFDTVNISVSADDDTLPPSFSNFSPDTVSDTTTFYIECKIQDISGVYDDNTGSNGQGVYLLWDNDGEIAVDANEVQMDSIGGGIFRTIHPITPQSPGTLFVYKIYAYDNDFDTDHPLDRTQGNSGLKRVIVKDVRGPSIDSLIANPNPTSGDTLLILKALISDSSLGNSVISDGEYFIDNTGIDSTGSKLKPLDGTFDSLKEWGVDTLNISSWATGSSHWIYVHGLDKYGNWGRYDSVNISVTSAPDTILPYVVSTSPADSDTQVNINSNIAITFSEPMDTSTIIPANFNIEGKIYGNYTFTLNYNNNTAVLDPDTYFVAQDTITATVYEFVKDTTGNAMKNRYIFTFTAGSSEDSIGPYVQWITAYPETTEGAMYSHINAFLEDSEMSDISIGEIFVDSIGTNGLGVSAYPYDGLFDEPSESIYVDLRVDTIPLGLHWIYLHGKDVCGNWGKFDSLSIDITPDDDSTGPTFLYFSPDIVPDTTRFRIYTVIKDTSGVYDDNTGSNGQGVYLLWDNDGEIASDAYEYQLSKTSGDTFATDLFIPKQNAYSNFVYQVYAYDNDTDFSEITDRAQSSSPLKSIYIKDSQGPHTSNLYTFPSMPSEHTQNLIVYATVSDSNKGNSPIGKVWMFVDSLNDTLLMNPSDGIFNDVVEEAVDTLNISSWKAGETHRIWIRGLDFLNNIGNIDSMDIYVSEYVDTFPPTVAATFPDSGKRNVPLNTWIYATFSEPMDPSTITSDKILIEGNNGKSYTFWMSYNTSDSTLSINPDADFDEMETVTVYIASNVYDLAGNSMVCQYEWSFITKDTTLPLVDTMYISPDTLYGLGNVVFRARLSDNYAVANAEYFIDSIRNNGDGIPMTSDSIYGLPLVSTTDTLKSLDYGEHWIYAHSLDSAGNWGRYDSVSVYISPLDTTPPNFLIEFPDTVYIGKKVSLYIIPSEKIIPESTHCTITLKDTTFPISLTFSNDTLRNILESVGWNKGDAKIHITGYDRFGNQGTNDKDFVVIPYGEFLPPESTYVYPNPAQSPGEVHFHLWVNQNATVSIRIFNLAGEFKNRIDLEAKGGTSIEKGWDISSIGSDVYIFIVDAVAGDGTHKRVIKKMAVVR